MAPAPRRGSRKASAVGERGGKPWPSAPVWGPSRRLEEPRLPSFFEASLSPWAQGTEAFLTVPIEKGSQAVARTGHGGTGQ